MADGLRLYYNLTKWTLGKLCRQGALLLAGLVLLCIGLPLLAGVGAEAVLSEGVSFSGFTLVITGGEGDPTPAALEQYLGRMSDVRQYCQVEAMDQAEALAALEDGRAAAVLALPEDFIQAVQRGDNPDVRLIVDGSRPLESLLTFWVGQSAADLLAAVQAGVYEVLAQWDAHPPAGLPRAQVVMEINLRYVQWVLQRQDLFETEALLPTGALPIVLHYRLCLLWYLILAMAPLFAWSFQVPWLTFQRRLRYALRSPLYGFSASLTACWAVMAAVIAAALVPLDLPLSGALKTALAGGAFFAVYAAFCSLASSHDAGCGSLSFLLTLAALALAGGIVPPVLLPQDLRRLEVLSPIAWMRDLAAEALGYGGGRSSVWTLLAAAAALAALSAWLYLRRIREMEGRG